MRIFFSILLFSLFIISCEKEASDKNVNLQEEAVEKRIDSCLLADITVDTIVSDSCCTFAITLQPTSGISNINIGYFLDGVKVQDFNFTNPISIPLEFCGEENRIVEIYINGSLCFSQEFSCSECCDDTEISFRHAVSVNPQVSRCCIYEVTATNNNYCEKTLLIDGLGSYNIPTNGKRVVNVEVCDETRFTISDNAGNLCFDDIVDCNCCSLLDVEIIERPNTNGSDCCYYKVRLTNNGECEITMKDKFGDPVVIILPGETRTTWQQACNGIDKTYELFTTDASGKLIECDAITLKADCDEIP